MQYEVCFTCKKFVKIGQDYEQKQKVKEFEIHHQSHPLQVVNEGEVGEEYENEFKTS